MNESLRTATELRRQRLRQRLTNHEGILLLNTPQYPAQRDRYLSYASDTSFRYLTGSEEPEAALFLTKDEELFFHRVRTPREIDFDGVGPDWSKLFLKSKMQVRDLSALVKVVQSFDLKDLQVVAGVHVPHDLLFSSLGVRLKNDLESWLTEMRWRKDEIEISSMRRAGQIAAKGHLDLEKFIKAGASESELKDQYQFLVKRLGSGPLPYNSIFAGGSNATILHHVKSEERGLNEVGLLVDAGASFEGYASDCTRTHWIGQSCDEFLEIHRSVQHAHDEAIKTLGRLKVSLQELHAMTEQVLFDDLRPLLKLNSMADLRELFFHKTSHWIGLDVHDPDPDRFLASQPIVAGVSLTIEPGIYFRERVKDKYPRYANIGVRIENTVLKTDADHGFEILTRVPTVN